MSSARKIKLKLPAPKPRNPLVAPLMQRKAGAHRKSASALRSAEKRALKKQPPLDKACAFFRLKLYCSKPATTLMLSAKISMLKPNDSTLWTNVRRRISREVTCTSDTCEVMPTTWA